MGVDHVGVIWIDRQGAPPRVPCPFKVAFAGQGDAEIIEGAGVVRRLPDDIAPEGHFVSIDLVTEMGG